MLVYKMIFAILSFMLGASFASFAGVIAYRLPKGISLIKPDSFCPYCKKSIKFYDNIPVLSWVLLGGKCRYCNSKIGVFSFVFEIIGGLGFVLTYLKYGDTVKTLPIVIALMLLIFLFVVISAIDYETHEIYDITLVLFAILSIFIVIYRVIVFNFDIWSHMFGMIFGFVFFFLIKIISKIVLKKDALGTGDVYLVGIAGFLLGVLPLLLSIITATSLGAVIELIKIKKDKSNRENEIAFAPYLLLGIGLMAIYGYSILKFYWEVIINAI